MELRNYTIVGRLEICWKQFACVGQIFYTANFVRAAGCRNLRRAKRNEIKKHDDSVTIYNSAACVTKKRCVRTL